MASRVFRRRDYRLQDSADAQPIERVRGENFTVAALLLPKRVRRHLLAIYVFARMVDDIGDEASGNRLALLDKVSRDLDHIYAGRTPRFEMLHELAVTIHSCDIPREPLQKLIEANRRDQVVHRYETYRELVDYCTLSANPVGHLVLYVFDAMTDDRRILADRVCTALQVLEHCQDVAEDLQRGRVYLPAEDLARFGVEEGDLKAPVAGRAVRALLAFQTQRALRLLDSGAPLVDSLHGYPRLAIAGYVAGGRATAKALAGADYDVLSGTPRPAKARMLAEWTTLMITGARS